MNATREMIDELCQRITHELKPIINRTVEDILEKHINCYIEQAVDKELRKMFVSKKMVICTECQAKILLTGGQRLSFCPHCGGVELTKER